MEEWLKIKLEKADELIEKQEYNEAIRLFIESLELTDVTDELLQIHNSLAYLNQTLGDQESAVIHYSKAIEIIQSQNIIDGLDKENMAHLHSSLAHSYMLLENTEEAASSLKIAIETYKGLVEQN